MLDLLRWWTDRDPPEFTDITGASTKLREQLAGRRVLVVMDDVWRGRDLVPFVVSAPARRCS